MGVVGGVLGVACCSGEGQEQHSTGSVTSVATATDPPIIGGATASSVTTAVLTESAIAEAMAEEIGDGALVFDNKKSLFEQLEKMIAGDETILVKGSRCAAMDEVVDRLRGEVS